MIIKIMEWVISNKYIEHENSIYHQVDGIVMGEALSVMVANIFMYKVVEEKFYINGETSYFSIKDTWMILILSWTSRHYKHKSSKMI